MTAQIPRPASTLICLNVTTKWPHKVLLVKRSDQSSFLPGAYVFPGGRVDPSDEAWGQWLESDRANFERISHYFPKNHKIRAHLACAMRETLEETGISVAKIVGEASFLEPQALAKLINGEIAPAMADLSHIWPISWWITPEGETRRFDTHFFLALLPEQQSVTCQGETSQPLWLSPTEALALYEERTIFLAPPTRAILERMSMVQSFEELLSHLDTRLEPICPYFVEHESGKLLVLPGDELHHEGSKSQFIMKTRYVF